MSALTSRASGGLAGDIAVPGDKSISHRALMLGAAAVGETRIQGLLEGADVLATARCVRAMGAEAVRERSGQWRVHGVGVGGLHEPEDVLDMGNAGTAARLFAGLLATHPFTCFMTGDASLRARPMARVTAPLRIMGADFVGRTGERLPMAIIGTAEPVPIVYELPVASAQVKSAILLAALNTPGETTVIEPHPTRDHSERMLRHFGAQVTVAERPDGGRSITLVGQPELEGRHIVVPGDISSAAFPLVAALIVPGSRLRLKGVGVNPLRNGLLASLLDMGADLRLENAGEADGEPVADIVATAGPLKGIEVPPERAPTMIDEYPVLAVAASFAEGRSRFAGIGEMRVKESDRLAAMARGLAACGVSVEERQDELLIEGRGGDVAGGGAIATALDHRIAMAFLVLGMASREAVRIDDAGPMDTSFPGFADLLNGVGARLEPSP